MHKAEDSIKIIAAGGLVSNAQKELLMIFRRGKWDLPKGKQDDGESIAACALREVQEETGLQHICLGNLAGITHHQYIDEAYSGKRVDKETHWYFMQVEGNPALHPQAEEDIETAVWCNRQAVEQNMQNSYANIIEIVRKGFLLHVY